MAQLIQGFFFQNTELFDVAHRSEAEGGSRVVIREGLCRFMYSGVIFPDPDVTGELIGEMLDHFGESKLLNVEITPEEMSFTKKYDQRGDTINYRFRREGEMWVGEYSGSQTGRGGATCITTEAPDNLLLPPEKL